MDIEFHYYQTLIAKRAGFGLNEAYKIAYASQYVDDNDIIFEINKDDAHYYKNYISQTINILKPKLLQIYPFFHFIPGNYDDLHARRKDGKMHLLNTTPNSSNAHAIFDNAMKGVLEKALPDIRHADAKHSPDLPGLIWKDERLISAHSRVNNRQRFLEAANQLFHKLCDLAQPDMTTEQRLAEA